MLELKILAVNVLLPTFIVSATLLGLRFLTRPKRLEASGAPDEQIGDVDHRAATTLVVLASLIAIWLAFGIRVGFSMWPEDAWARLPHSVGLATLGSLIGLWCEAESRFAKLVGWLARILSLIVAAQIMIPAGEAWEFLKPTKNIWWVSMAASPLIIWWIVSRLPDRSAAYFGFGSILCIAGAAILSSQFLRVTEPMLAIASVMGCTSIAAWRTQNSLTLAAVAGPCFLGMAAIVASAQFNSYEGLPDSLSWFAIATPAIASILSLPVLSKKQARPVSWKEFIVTLLVCLALAVCVVVWMTLAGGAGGEEDW